MKIRHKTIYRMRELGIIFDWDGVIVDSSKQHQESWEVLAKEENKSLPQDPDHFKQGFGRKNSYIIPEILKWSQDSQEIERIANRKEVIYRKLIQSEGVLLLPGVLDLLKLLTQENLPFAIGSSTPRENLEFTLKILKIQQYFKTIVAAEDVTVGKPHPEVFLKAAKALNLSPNRCVVFEDSHAGIQAALAAGMTATAVTTSHRAETFTTAHWVIDSLKRVDIATLLKLTSTLHNYSHPFK